MEKEIEKIGSKKEFGVISTKELIKVDFLPKGKSPISNLFLVAPLFTPCSKNISIENKYREVKVEDQFGYSVEVKGQRLNMSVDFPIWSHIIRYVVENETNEITMHYVDFAKILGYDRRNLGAVLKKRIKDSLVRLHSQTIISENKDGDEVIMGLLDHGTIKKKTKEVEMVINKKAIELYKQDRFQLIDIDYYNTLNNEVTKALFLYYENHAKTVYPIKLKSIKERLNLVSNNSREVNRQIKNGHKNLIEKRYLKEFKEEGTGSAKTIKVVKNLH